MKLREHREVENTSYIFDRFYYAETPITLYHDISGYQCELVWFYFSFSHLLWNKEERDQNLNKHVYYESNAAKQGESKQLHWSDTCFLFQVSSLTMQLIFLFYIIFFLIIFFNKSSLFESWIHDKVWSCLRRLLHLRALLSIPNQLILVSFTFTTLGSEIHFLKGKQMAIKTMKLKRTQTRLKTLSLRLPMSVGTCRVEILILVFSGNSFLGD